MYKFALKREPKKKEEEEEEYEDEYYEGEDEEDEEEEREKGFQYEEVRVHYLDDSCRERWRKGIARMLNQLELSGLSYKV